MRIVLQRVSEAQVTVEGRVVASIGRGVVLLVAVAPADTHDDISAAAEKVANLRVFPDDQGLMNRSLVDVSGRCLVVSQFTLLADIRRGRRPSFSQAARPEVAAPMVDALVREIRSHGVATSTGQFGARMSVSLVNDGPVTLSFEVREGRVG